MAYLNWKDSPHTQAVAPHEQRGHELTLMVSPGQRDELAATVEGALAEGGELRLDLSHGWVIFWKKREGESRLLLAHPQEDEWVATISLEESDLLASLRAIRSLAAGSKASLGEVFLLGSISNLEFTIEVQG